MVRVAGEWTIAELRELCDTLANDVSARRHAFINDPNPDRLHSFRVAVRSARSLLVLTRDSFTCEDLALARETGARLSYDTGHARNLDVVAGHWQELTLELDSDVVVNLAPVLALINEVRLREYRYICEKLRSDESNAFETEMKRLANVESTTMHAHQVVRKAIKRINKRIITTSAGLSDLAPDEVLHQARKDLKKLRYSLEMTRSHFPTRTLEKFIEAVAELQTVIGRHQDAVVFANELWNAGRKLSESASPESVVSIGILLAPIEAVRRQARRKSLAKLRAFADTEVQHQFRKLVGSID